MSMEPDIGKHVEDKIDILLAKLNPLMQQVDTLTDRLTRADAEAVREAFRKKQEGSDGG